MAAPTARGRFVWHELMTSNPDAAAAFYGKVIGWTTQGWPQDPSYRMWSAGGIPVGGLMALTDQAKLAGAPPHWLSYIGVPDVDASARQATGLGARTQVPPQDIPNAGRFAVLVDPQGAAFALYASSQPEGAEPEFGGFSWHELATTDYQAAWKFYRALFGWENTSTMDMGPAGVYFMFGLGGVPVGGIYNKPLEVPMPNWLPYVRVKSADGVAAATKRAGGRALHGPEDVPAGGRIFTGLDPQGAAFAVHQEAAAKPATSRKSKSKSKPKPKAKKKAAKAKAKKTSAKKTATKKARRR